MGVTLGTVLRPLTVSGVEAACIGILAGGCRLAFAAPAAHQLQGMVMLRLAARMRHLGGALIQVQSEEAAAVMAAGAAMAGARAAAIVADSCRAAGALTGFNDLSPVLVDVSGRLPLALPAGAVLAPHTPQAAFDTGAALFDTLPPDGGIGVIAGLEGGSGMVEPDIARRLLPPPIHQDGPDDPEILIIGAGPGFDACDEARSELALAGVAAAHVHLIHLAPFPAAIVAPAVASARRVLVVESGGPGTLAGYIRSYLGAPAAPFGELPRLAGAPLGADEIAWQAREVMGR
ncbi:MAG: Pyruvate:ferredoxin oxidoreductase core domain [Firmicutes bacterium]|nr:Pyruvate:ferredoxin oxidoreductase core domain [Bacillota bacterium]